MFLVELLLGGTEVDCRQEGVGRALEAKSCFLLILMLQNDTLHSVWIFAHVLAVNGCTPPLTTLDICSCFAPCYYSSYRFFMILEFFFVSYYAENYYSCLQNMIMIHTYGYDERNCICCTCIPRLETLVMNLHRLEVTPPVPKPLTPWCGSGWKRKGVIQLCLA